ncbi:MAG TPA: YSC84-related protein [Steroidobacteraceae bacterium]|nr:YSC84-related protein [Steroidobacteraceae bacterium]
MIKNIFGSFLMLGVLASPVLADEKADKERTEILSASAATLEALYKANPEARGLIQKAAGYATFSNFGMKILFVGGGKGKGVVVDNKSKRTTFMNMGEAQAGLGMGAKKFRVVFVFQQAAAMNKFIDEGWAFGGQATAAATTGDTGGAMQGAASVAPGVWMYQLTDKGLAAEITAKGTKYWKDKDLN